jgi:uncharacterized protein (DUF488 family)
MKRIWTIGHSTRSSEKFIALLTAHAMMLVADVRRFPGSRKHPQFGQAALQAALRSAGLEYVHLPELGGRRQPRADSPNTAWRNEAFRGYADYMQSDDYRSGIERLLRLAGRARTVVMCAEALWWRCHRALIADDLKVLGAQVLHIRGAVEVQEHPYTAAARILNGKLSYAAQE